MSTAEERLLPESVRLLDKLAPHAPDDADELRRRAATNRRLALADELRIIQRAAATPSPDRETPPGQAGELDAAWAAAEAARQSPTWNVSVRRRTGGRWEAWAQDLASNERPPIIRIGEGDTEAAALLDLAARLSAESGPESES